MRIKILSLVKRDFIYTIFILVLSLLTLPSCNQQVDKKNYNTKLSFQYLILEKTNLQLDTSWFTISLDSNHHTDGAFDSDYSWFVKSQFNNACFEKLKRSIRTITGFCAVDVHEEFYNANWAKIDTSKIKDIWTMDSVFL
jgi:hypothetical protein